MFGCCQADDSTKLVEQVKKQDVTAPEPTAQEDPSPANYTPTTSKLVVSLVGVRGVRNADWFPGTGTSDCYCVLTVGGQEKIKTKVISDSLMPIWMEEAEITDYVIGQALELAVWDKDMGPRNDCLGKVVLGSEMFENEGFNQELLLEEAGKGVKAYLKVMIKLEGKEYPEGPPKEFKVCVEKDAEKPWGLDLDISDGTTAYVNGVTPGPLKAYNDTVGPEAQLLDGQYIVKVNGANNTQAMLAELKTNNKLEIVVRRPLEFTFPVDMSGEPGSTGGLEFPAILAKTSVMVAKVCPGPVEDWNKGNDGYDLKPLDRIIAVGGQRGTGAELLAKLKKEDKAQITVSRIFPGPHTESSAKPWFHFW